MFGYFGHRHDQSILSILAARYKAPVQSARRYCLAAPASSERSRHNWKTEFREPISTYASEPDQFYVDAGVILMQHRGTYLNHDGLRFKQVTSVNALVLGDAHSTVPSGNFSGDALFFHGTEFPQGLGPVQAYYQTLMTDEIGYNDLAQLRDLVANADGLNIGLFLLRESVTKLLQDCPNRDRIINFDLLRIGSKILHQPVATGSLFNRQWASYLGFSSITCL